MLYILIFAAAYLAMNIITNGKFSQVYMRLASGVFRIALIAGFIVLLLKVRGFEIPDSPALKNLAGLLIIPLIAFNVWAVRKYMKSKSERAQ